VGRGRRHPILIVAAGLILLAGCGDDDGDETESAASLPEGCEAVSEPLPREGQAERPAEQLRGPATAVVETSCGTFEIALDTAAAPKTTSSFASLAAQGYYDDTAIIRVQRDYVIQGGDPTGTRTGGPGYTIDEPPPPDTAYLRGTVAMAKSPVEPRGRSGGQFFVVTAPADAGLPPDYAVVGEVTSGLDVIDRINELGDPAGADGPPVEPVVIRTVTIRRS
jgi:peptidyl-prolyl cis-trans isomerase B (cyclophilin B)